MAVTRVSRRQEREGSVESQRNNLLYETLGRRYRIEFNAYTNTYKDGSKVVLVSSMLPQIGDPYSIWNDSDTLATCVRVTANATGSPTVWRVVAEFDTDRIVAMITDNPLNQPPDITWDFQKEEAPMVRDALGIQVLSSSKRPFDPPFTTERVNPILKIRRNEASFDADIARQYHLLLNNVTFLGYPPAYARINSITGQSAVTNGVLHAQVDYEIEFRPFRGWFTYVLDQDFRDIDGQQFRDPRDFSPLSNPTPLNGRGRSMYKSFSKIYLTALTNIATSVLITPSDDEKFPPDRAAEIIAGIRPGPHNVFYLKIGNEEVKVTGRTGAGIFTIVRGQNYTTAAAHAVDTRVELLPYELVYLPHPFGSYDPLALPV